MMKTNKENLFENESRFDQKPVNPEVSGEKNLFTPKDPIFTEITLLRSQLADVMHKIGDMRWGRR